MGSRPRVIAADHVQYLIRRDCGMLASVLQMSYGNRGSNRYGGGRSGGYSSGYSSGGGYGPKPVEVGKEYDVEVTELSRRGDGVAKIQGFIIFVKGAKVGDKVKIKVETVGPRFATAAVVGGSTSTPAESKSTSSTDTSMTESVS
jgi:predicted RNA-binding protein with TRAM domain